MKVDMVLYVMAGGSACAVPPTARANPTAAAIAATIRAILICASHFLHPLAVQKGVARIGMHYHGEGRGIAQLRIR